MKWPMIVLVSVLGIHVAVGAVPPKTPAKTPATPEEIRQQIEQLERKLSAAEREAEKAQAIEEEAHEFAEIQAESRERMADYDARLEEIKHEDAPETLAGQKYLNACISHINACHHLDQKIQALKDGQSIEQARKLQDEIETLQVKWDIVLEPMHEMSARIGEMEQVVAEANHPELVAVLQKLRTLHDEDAAIAKKQFELWQIRKKNRMASETATEDFWETFEKLERLDEAE